MASMTPDAQSEITRLKNEVHAKEETLNQLKLKTKTFVDNMRNELAHEKKKVAELEEQLKHAKETSASLTTTTHGPEVEALKQEIATVTQRENELKTRAKTFADNMKAQLQAEKDRAHQLELQLQEKTAALANSQSNAQQTSEVMMQLQAAQQEIQRLQQTNDRQDAMTVTYETQVQSLQREVEQLRTALQNQQSAQGSAEAAFAAEHSHLEQALCKNHEIADQMEQYKIEIEHLQKQLLDKDFQLEQLDNYRLKADENEAKAFAYAGEIAQLKQQLHAQMQQTQSECEKCQSLAQELSEMTRLYEKVNRHQSQSDAQLAEAQTVIHHLKTELQTAQQRMDEVSAHNMKLNEQIFHKDNQIEAFKYDAQKQTAELQALQEKLQATKSDSFQSEADKQKAAQLTQQLTQQVADLTHKNQELTTSIETTAKANTEKLQKAKALLVSLTNEKQSLQDAKNDLQKEVDRLRMELNQRNVENDKRLKQLHEENAQKLAQSTSNLQKLNDEISTLKQALTVLQESEKSQQRAKELANAKREVEESNKKRLAAKAETQKLAMDLEAIQKLLSQLCENTTSNCATNSRKMTMLHDRVQEALQVLEKRASANKKLQNTSPSNQHDDIQVEDIRQPESATSAQTKLLSPSTGAKKAEDSIVQLNERLNALVDVTEKLCDLAVETHDVNLKDVVVDKVTQLFTQCFSEKLRAAYTKVEEVEGLITTRS